MNQFFNRSACYNLEESNITSSGVFVWKNNQEEGFDMDTATKLWNKNFIAYIIAFEFSQIGDALLRFAIPLYILMATNNPALLGTVMTLSWIPFIIFTPIGGVMADRFDKRKIMISFNILISLVIIGYISLTGVFETVWLPVIVWLLILIFQSLQSTSYETALYSIIPLEELLKANQITFILMIASGIIAPIAAGYLLNSFGLELIIVLSLAGYIIGTLMNYLIKIPKFPVEAEQGMFKTLVADIQESFRYMKVTNREMGRASYHIFLYSLLLFPILALIPNVLINAYLEMNERGIGFAGGIIATGGVLGVLILGKLKNRISICTFPKLLAASAVTLMATILLFMVSTAYLAYAVLVFGLTLVNTILVMLSTLYFTYLGQNTPEEILGKIFSFGMTIMMIGGTLAVHVVGRGFEILSHNLAFAALILPVATLTLLLLTRKKRTKLTIVK